MNRLSEEHLHLLLDEPIYVLADHGDHPSPENVAEQKPAYTGGNEKGIGIFAEDLSEDDLIFLFKGLNALNIEEKDVAIFNTDFESTRDYPAHDYRLRFSDRIRLDDAFKVSQKAELTLLNALPLAEIRYNQDFKRQFWEALKQMFRN